MDHNLSPRDKLLDGKRRLARASNNPDTLERALEIIDAALLEHLRSIFPRANIGTYRLFDQLQRDHIIDAAERALLGQMHALRNRSAHANRLYLTQRYVQQYADLVTKVLGATSRPRKSPPKQARRRPRPPQDRTYSASNKRSISPSPIPSKTLMAAPSPRTASPPLLQPSLPSTDDTALLSSLLQVELGGDAPLSLYDKNAVLDDNELLQSLLFS